MSKEELKVVYFGDNIFADITVSLEMTAKLRGILNSKAIWDVIAVL